MQCTERNINLFDGGRRNLGNRSFYDHTQTFGDPPAAGASGPEVNNPMAGEITTHALKQLKSYGNAPGDMLGR
jgi:hypothetical protein